MLDHHNFIIKYNESANNSDVFSLIFSIEKRVFKLVWSSLTNMCIEKDGKMDTTSLMFCCIHIFCRCATVLLSLSLMTRISGFAFFISNCIASMWRSTESSSSPNTSIESTSCTCGQISHINSESHFFGTSRSTTSSFSLLQPKVYNCKNIQIETRRYRLDVF